MSSCMLRWFPVNAVSARVYNHDLIVVRTDVDVGEKRSKVRAEGLDCVKLNQHARRECVCAVHVMLTHTHHRGLDESVSFSNGFGTSRAVIL
jgi:hypothetical protein